MNLAVEYIKNLRLWPDDFSHWQSISNYWEVDSHHYALLVEWLGDNQVQTVIEVPVKGGRVRWLSAQNLGNSAPPERASRQLWADPDAYVGGDSA